MTAGGISLLNSVLILQFPQVVCHRRRRQEAEVEVAGVLVVEVLVEEVLVEVLVSSLVAEVVVVVLLLLVEVLVEMVGAVGVVGVVGVAGVVWVNNLHIHQCYTHHHKNKPNRNCH